MPTIASAQIPPPDSWTEFEDIMLSAAKLRWRSSDFFGNGRPGQKQDGVDVWGHDADSRHIGVQCKNTVGGVSQAVVVAELGKAEAFSPALDALYIATTARRDAPLQQAVRELSAARKAAGKFTVNILFWNDICQDLAANDDVFFGHYPQFRLGADPAKAHDIALFGLLTTLLTSDGVIGFLDRTNMAGFSFPKDALDPLHAFRDGWNAPEREFMDAEIDALRQQLWTKADAYLGMIAFNAHPTSSPGRLAIPPEWELQNSSLFRDVVGQLHSLAGEIVALHRDLLRRGRERLLRK